MSDVIGEIKNVSPISITENDDGTYLIKSNSTKWKMVCNKEQYEVITQLFDINQIRKPYSRSVLRKKMIDACNSLSKCQFVFFNELEGKKHRPVRSFLHLRCYVNPNYWDELLSFMTSMYNKNLITYLRIGHKQAIFSDGGNFEEIKKLHQSSFQRNNHLSVYVGIISLKFFKYLSLNSLNPDLYKIEGDYSYYIQNNSIINHINDELEGTY